MNQEIKKLWVTALRSGKFSQGRNTLLRKDKYCCLGVLCAISPFPYENWRGENYLPVEIVHWAELSSRNPRVGKTNLGEINDVDINGFQGIADIIEKEL